MIFLILKEEYLLPKENCDMKDNLHQLRNQ